MFKPSIRGRRLGLSVLAMLLVLVASVPAAAEAARPPLGKYSCLYPPFNTLHPMKLVSKSKYTVDGAHVSKYKYKRGKIVFRKGIYSDYYARYEVSEKQIVIYDKATDARLWNCVRKGGS